MSNDINSDSTNFRPMRIEILVASPPTSKCKSILGWMKEMIQKNPDRLKLDIYYAGMQLSITPTQGYQAEGKLKKVPSIFVNGICATSGEVPDFEELERIIESELSRGHEFWLI